MSVLDNDVLDEESLNESKVINLIHAFMFIVLNCNLIVFYIKVVDVLLILFNNNT